MEDEEIHKATSQCSSNDKNRRANKKRSALNNTTRNNQNNANKKSIWDSESNETTEPNFQRRNNDERSSRKKCKRSGITLTPIRKKISRTMSLAFSRSSSTVARADIKGFQTAEHEKTVVRKNLKWHATLLFILAVIATGLVLLDTQIKILWIEQQTLLNSLEAGTKTAAGESDKRELYRNVGIATKSILSVISIITCISLLYYYKNLFRMKKVRHFYPPKMSFMRAKPLLKKYAIECVICLFHVPPMLDLYADIPNEVQLIVILRLYLLGRYLKERHELMNSQSTRFLASVTKTELTSMFLFKTFFMQYPFQLILLAYVILLFIGGYGVWMIENRYSYLDTVWMLIITMTTVGFGDLTPKTMLGRFCVGITAIVGIFLMALFISLVNEALMLQRREKRILAYVENQDLTRHRKITALNAIGMWYKYYSHMNRHFRNAGECVSFLGGYKRETPRKDLMNKLKGKLLETEMFQAVNEWRKIKNARGGNYFAQEFMIEDMKNMMVDLNGKVNEMDEKLENVTSNLKDMSDNNNNKTNNVHQKKLDENVKHSCTCIHEDKQRSNHSNKNLTGIPKQNTISGLVHQTMANSNHRNKNNGNFNGPYNMERFEKFVLNSQLNIRELLHEDIDIRTSTNGIQKSELVVAFKLLKNQAKIMNNALDDIYFKTRQDICDLENLINSLLICTEDGDMDSVDYIPSRELPV